MNHFRSQTGEQFVVIYYANRISGEKAVITQVISSRSTALVKKYSPAVMTLVNEAIQETENQASKKLVSSAKSVSALRDTSNKLPNSKFKAIWAVSTWSYSPSSGMWGAQETIVAAFNDGTMSKNFSFILFYFYKKSRLTTTKPSAFMGKVERDQQQDFYTMARR